MRPVPLILAMLHSMTIDLFHCNSVARSFAEASSPEPAREQEEGMRV
jgi:hypothetical protein